MHCVVRLRDLVDCVSSYPDEILQSAFNNKQKHIAWICLYGFCDFHLTEAFIVDLDNMADQFVRSILTSISLMFKVCTL